MRVLDLSLTYFWYDMISSGVKKEEYRELKPFYWKRLVDLDKYKGCYKGCTDYYNGFDGCINCKYINWKYYDAVRFHRGQGSPVTMLVECKGIHIGTGKPEWGAVYNKNYFVIELGNILERNGSQG